MLGMQIPIRCLDWANASILSVCANQDNLNVRTVSGRRHKQ